MKLQHGSQHVYQLTWCQILLLHYFTTQLTDRVLSHCRRLIIFLIWRYRTW